MYPNLNAEMARKSKTQIDLMKVLGLKTTAVISEKMNGKRDFKLKECKCIIDKLFPNCSIDYLFSFEPKDKNM